MEDLLKSLENARKIILTDIQSGEFKSNESHLKGMIAGLEIAIKTIEVGMETNKEVAA